MRNGRSAMSQVVGGLLAAAVFLAGGCRVAPPTTPASPNTFQVPDTPPQSGPHQPPDPQPVHQARPSHSAQPSLGPTASLPGVRPAAHVVGAAVTAAPPPKPPQDLGSAPASDFTLVDLEALALQNNPALAEAEARLSAMRGAWIQAGLWPNPVLGYSGQQLGSGGVAEQQGVYIGQSIITARKLALDQEIAAWQIQRLEQEWEAQRLRVLTDVRIAYYRVLIAQDRRRLAAELVRISQEGLRAAQALFQADEVSQADPLRARIEADRAAILFQNAVYRHQAAWRTLAAVVGMPDLALHTLKGELKPDQLLQSWQEELVRVLSDSPEIAAALAEVEAARWGIERAYAQVVPDIEVQAVIQDDRGTGNTNANLQVTFPLPLFNRNQGGIQQARAALVAADRAVDRRALDIQARLASAFERYQNAWNQVEKFTGKEGILANSRRTLELIRAGYKAEEFGVLDLLAAQRTYFQTNMAYLDALEQLSEAVMEVRGRLLRGSLAR